MPSIEIKHQFRGSLDTVFKAITSFEKYPEYLQGMNSIKISEPTKPGSSCLARYELTIIKKFFYVLNMYVVEPSEVKWDLEESNLMKQNNGFWHLKASGKNAVNATYGLDIKFRGLVPTKITDQIAKINIPIMFEGFQSMIDDMQRLSSH